MLDIILIVALVLVFLIGLAVVPLGLPGLWLMVVALVAYGALGRFEQVGWIPIATVLTLALVAEAAEAWLGFRLAKRRGASNRAGWGALLGGLAGALAGTPIPVIGNVIGAFIGAFVGAVLLERNPETDIRVTLGAGWNAVLGRAAGAAVKIAIGLVIAIIGVYSALR